MKLSGVLVICFTNIILRATSSYAPVVLVYHQDHSSLFLLAGFLTFLLLSFRKRKPVTASTTSTTTIPQPRCSNGYTLYPGPGKSFCYRLYSDCKPWNEARTACQMEGADLTSLDKDSLQPFLDVMRQQLPAENCDETKSFWLGATTNDTRVAVYVNGKSIPSDSPLWDGGEPDTPGQCIRPTYEVNTTLLVDRLCGVSERYVCQKQL